MACISRCFLLLLLLLLLSVKGLQLHAFLPSTILFAHGFLKKSKEKKRKEKRRQSP
jgi:hypothetical protein